MARDVEQLVLTMSADLRRFEKEMQRSGRVARDAIARVEAEAVKGDRNVSRIFGQMGSDAGRAFSEGLRNAASGIAAGFTAQATVQAVDAYTRFQNALKVAGLEGQELAKVQAQLIEVAKANGVALEPVAQLYGRVSQSSKDLNVTQADTLKITQAVAAALRISGASTESASGALLQLAQALGGTKIQAEEYNSLIDGLGPLLKGVAAQTANYGGSVSKLTADVKAGNVTSREFATAIIGASNALVKQARDATPTFAAAMENLKTSLTIFIGETDASLGASERLKQGVEALANNIDLVVDAVGLLATVIGSRYAVSAVAATAETVRYQLALMTLAARQAQVTTGAIATTTAIAGLNRAMAFFGGPVGLAITAVAGAVYLLSQRSQQAAKSSAEMRTRVDEAYASLEQEQKAAKALTAQTGNLDAAQLAAAKTAANLTGEADKLTDAHYRAAAAAKAQAVELARLDAIRARGDMISAQRELAQRQDQAERQFRGPTGAGDRAGAGGAAAVGLNSAEVIRRGAIQSAAQSEEAKRLQRAAKVYLDEFKNYQDLRDDPLAKFLPPKTTATGKPGTSKSGAGPKGRSASDDFAEALARRAERLATMPDIDDVLDARALEAATAALNEQFDALTSVADQTERAADVQRGMIDLQDEALQLEIDLARLRGDSRALEVLEREYEIRRRIAQLGDNRENAEAEVALLDRARLQGEFRDAFRGGLQSALDGDLGGFVQNWWRDRTAAGLEQALDSVADLAFRLFADAFKGGGQGGGSGSGVASALMQIGKAFAGGRATGGPVQAGRAYVVGERGPELLVPSVGGTVLPNMKGLMHKVSNGSPAVRPIVFDMRGAVMTEDLLRQAEETANAQVFRSAPAMAKGSATLARQDMFRAQRRALGRI